MVYPRVCGGIYNFQLPDNTFYGLSPRVRGNRRGGRDGPEYVWSIPACAGESARLASLCTDFWVYPRVCGGIFAKVAVSFEEKGLSPRVRGNPVPVGGRRLSPGSIPACAGESTTRAVLPAHD